MRDQIEPAVASWRDQGFAVLPGFISAETLRPALVELPQLFPSADEFHDRVNPEENGRFGEEFGGIIDFPFASVELSLLAVHDSLVELAVGLLGTTDLRVIGIEAWAKYTGAVDYDQNHHRDYLSHTSPARSCATPTST